LRCSDASSADNAIDINDGNGAIPACGNDLMMNRIYREQFLFSGFIVSDCDSIGEPSFEEYIGRRVSRSGPACDLRWRLIICWRHNPDCADRRILRT